MVNTLLAFAILIGLATLPLLLDLGIRLLRRRVRRRRWVGVPEAEIDEPIRAVKRARLRIAPSGGDATLSGLTLGGRYEAEDDARCPRGCPSPADGCDCGFYALRPEAENHVFRTSERLRRATTVRLEVELSGSVLEYELGYRAQHQRVLRVIVPSICASCARFDATQEAVALVAVPPAQNPYGVSVLSRTAPGSRENWATLEPTCELHRRARRAEPSVGLLDLAGMIGTEVVWEAATVTAPPDH